MKDRTLRLRREVLTQIDSAALAGAVGGQDIDPTTLVRETLLNTCFSCLTYISCNPLACVIRDTLETVCAMEQTAGVC